MTSYDGIIRIRLKGRSSVTSSQPATQAPLTLFFNSYTLYQAKLQGLFKISFLHVSDSLSVLHAAFAGLVEGRQTAFIPVFSSENFL